MQAEPSGVIVEYGKTRGINNRRVLAFLEHLVHEADQSTGEVEQFSLTGCSKELTHLGVGERSGRRTIGGYLKVLEEAGIAESKTSRGGSRRHVKLVDHALLSLCDRAIDRAPDRAIPSNRAVTTARFDRAITADRAVTTARFDRAIPPNRAVTHPGSPGQSSESRGQPAESGERGCLSSSSRGEEEVSLHESVRPVWEAYCRLAELRSCTPRRPTSKTVRDLAELTDKFGAASVVATLEFALTWPRSKWVQVILPNGLRELVARYDRIRLMKEQEDRQAAAPTYHSRRPAMIEAPTGLGSRVISL